MYYSDYMNPNTYCLWHCNNNLYVNNVTVLNVVYDGGQQRLHHGHQHHLGGGGRGKQNDPQQLRHRGRRRGHHRGGGQHHHNSEQVDTLHNIDSLLFSFPIYRESLRLTHGARKSFVLAFSQDLGSGVRLVNVEWRYDHDIDLLDPLKVCVLLLCSDSVYMQNVSITSISLQSTRRIFIPNKSAINNSGALTTTAGSSKSSLML